MRWLAHRSLDFLGLAGTGSGMGVVVPLSVKYSGDNRAVKVFDLVNNRGAVSRRGRGVDVGREAPDFMKNADKNLSEIDSLLKYLLDSSKKKVGYAYGGLGGLIKNRFKRDEEEQKREWDGVKQSLLGIRGVYEKVKSWQKGWVDNQDRRISSRFQELKAMAKDIKDMQNRVMHWQDGYVERDLLPEIEGLINLSKSFQSRL